MPEEGIIKKQEEGKVVVAAVVIPIVAVIASALLLMAPMLAAAAPHFVTTPKIVKEPDLSLTATFEAATLGDLVTDVFLTSSGGTAELQCVGPGGNDQRPQSVTFESLQGQTVQVTPSNGQVTASPTIGPPPLPDADELCPNPQSNAPATNWSVRIDSLTYNDVVLHVQQDGVDVLTFNFGDVDP